MFPMTPWVRRLLVANIVVFVVTQMSPPVGDLLTFWPVRIMRFPWTVYSVVTYMFVHAGLGHVAFNMLSLFFFGPRLETRLGSRDFLLLYFLSGIGGALLSWIFSPSAAIVGASGAVFGVLLGFAMYWPRERIYIWAILPVEAWLLVTLMVLGSVYFGFTPSAGSRIAHFAHLGGAVFGFAFLKIRDWRTGAGRRAFQRKLRVDSSPSGIVGDRTALARWKGISTDRLHELNRGEVERLLAKATNQGPASLTQQERDFLDRMSRG